MTDYITANSIRELLLQKGKLLKDSGYSNIPMSFDALGMVGYKSGDCFTVKEAMERFSEAGIELSSSALRTALNTARSLGLLATRIHNNKKRGAPVTIYRLSSMQLIAEKLGVWVGAIDQISRKAVASLKNYCAHLHRAFIKRVPGRYKRKWLGERLGRGARSTYNYEKLFDDIEVIPQFIETPITWDDVPEIPEKPETGPIYLRVWKRIPYTPEEIAERTQHITPAWRSIALGDTYLKEFRYPYSQFFVRRELAAGNTCERVQQTANYYSVSLSSLMTIYSDDDYDLPEYDQCRDGNGDLDLQLLMIHTLEQSRREQQSEEFEY